jgi:phosphatidylethanolamine/phosphatidyl-N-methylethanolamine N-methyltransferase
MLFLKYFFKSTKHTGAIAPSSPFLARKIVDRSKIGEAKTIIELGPGTGAITKEILERMPENCNLWTFEINKDFIGHLEKKYPKARHIHADISDLKKVLEENKVGHVDAIISGIPFASLKNSECDGMMSEIDSVMSEDSRFVLFTYSPMKFKTFFSWFRKVDLSYVPINLPPAHVLTLGKKYNKL